MRIASDGGRAGTGSSTVPVRGPALDSFRMKALRMTSRSTWWLMALLIVAANVLGWQSLHRPLQAPGFDGKVAGMAYNAFQRWDDPQKRKFPSLDAVDADLALLAKHTRSLRTYRSSEIPELPALAERHGLR